MSEISRLYATLGFKIDDQGVKAFQKKLQQTAKKVNQFGNSVQKTTKPLRTQAVGIAALSKRYNKLAGTLQQVRNDYRKINEAYRKGDISLEKRKRILNEINRRYRELRHSTDAATQAQRRYNKTPANRRTGMGGNGLAIAAGAATAGYSAIQSSQAYQNFQGIQSGLLAATGDRKKAVQDFEYLVKLSKRLGTFIGDSAKNFTKLSAAAKGTDLEGQGVRDIFTAISSYGRVLNLSTGEMDSVLRGLSQTISKGQLYAEDVSGQIGEALPGFMQALARSQGYVDAQGNANVGALRKAMEGGSLTAEDVYPGLAEELMRMANSGDALSKAINNTSASFGRFRTNVWLSNKAFNESGFDSSMRSFVNQLSDALVRAEPLWEALGKASVYVGTALEAPVELFGVLASKLPVVEKFVTENSTAFKLLGAALVTVVKPLRKMFLFFAAIPLAMMAITDLLENWGRDRTFEEWAVQIGAIALGLYALKGPLKMVHGLFKGILGTTTAIGAATGGIKKRAGIGTVLKSASRVAGTAAIPVLIVGTVGSALLALVSLIEGMFDNGVSTNTGIGYKGHKASMNLKFDEPLVDVPKVIGEWWEDFTGGAGNVVNPSLRMLQEPPIPLNNTRTSNQYNVDAPLTIEISNYNNDPNELADVINSRFADNLNSVLRTTSGSNQVTER